MKDNKKPMKYLFYFGHPAQYLFLRESIRCMINDNNSVIILIKTKDVLEDIIKTDGLRYVNILPQRRGNSKLAIGLSFFKRIFKIFLIILRENPDVLVSSDAPTAILGKLFRKGRITITEDDYDVIRDLADLTYPYTETILCPAVCSVGKFDSKKVGYNGYMKLAYLHPNIFSRNEIVISKYGLNKKFVLVRLAQLTAFHDEGIKGLSQLLLDDLVNVIENNEYDAFISTEYPLEEKYNKYLLNINPSDLHKILSHATALVSDSQSMSVEAAMLGTPSLRFSSFAGRISVLEELEYKYGLTYGIKPDEPDRLLEKLTDLLRTEDIKLVFEKRRVRMLKEKIDVTQFLIWFLKNYPESRKIMIDDPDYQDRFH